MLEHGRRLTHCRVFQHLRRQRNGRYRRFKLMRHIVDKVILHLRQFLLAEHDINREDKRNQQHKGEYHRRYHKVDRVENIISFARKMYLYDTHTGRWIIQEQRLGVRILATFIDIVRTTVYFPSIPVNHLKVISQINAVIYQARL